jgi:hypothetical protein
MGWTNCYLCGKEHDDHYISCKECSPPSYEELLAIAVNLYDDCMNEGLNVECYKEKLIRAGGENFPSYYL